MAARRRRVAASKRRTIVAMAAMVAIVGPWLNWLEER